jgi:hypothetical protein
MQWFEYGFSKHFGLQIINLIFQKKQPKVLKMRGGKTAVSSKLKIYF